jgi:hypothetical protein
MLHSVCMLLQSVAILLFNSHVVTTSNHIVTFSNHIIRVSNHIYTVNSHIFKSLAIFFTVISHIVTVSSRIFSATSMPGYMYIVNMFYFSAKCVLSKLEINSHTTGSGSSVLYKLQNRCRYSLQKYTHFHIDLKWTNHWFLNIFSQSWSTFIMKFNNQELRMDTRRFDVLLVMLI